MGAPDNIDAYAPREIAKPVEAAGIAKANLPALQTLMLRTSRRCVHRIWRDALYHRRHQQRVGVWPGTVARRCRLFARLNLHTGRRAELFTGDN